MRTLPAGYARAGVPTRPSVLRNAVANIAGYAVSLGVGILYTPFLIRSLGPAGFGLVPLAATIASYLSLITLAINATVGRYVLVALERGEFERARRLYNTALVSSLALAALLLGPIAWGAWHANRFLSIPQDVASASRWLFLATGGAFLLTEIRAAFEVPLFCRNRLDIRSAVVAGETLIRVAVVFALFVLVRPSLTFVGVGFIASALAATLVSLCLARKLAPELTWDPSLFDLKALRELSANGGWIVFGHVGTLLFVAFDLVVVNLLLGAGATGRYAAVMQWANMLRGLSGAVSVVFAPTLTRLYAQGDSREMVEHARTSIRLGGAFIAIPVGLICGFAEPLLRLWIGPQFSADAPLLWMLTFHLSVNLAFVPLMNIPIAMNRVRTIGLVQTALGVANLCLALILAGPLQWGVYGVAGAGMLVLTAKNVLFTSVYTARLLGERRTLFLREITAPFVVAVLAALGTWAFGRIVAVSSLMVLAASAVGIGTIATVGVYWLVLDGNERRNIRRFAVRQGRAA
jgi:membrane protein EpsK